MTKSELKELMEYLALIDNRQLTPEKLQVWFDLIGFLDFDLAKEAVLLAQRESSIPYVEAKHVIAFANQIKERLKSQKQREEQMTVKKDFTSSPMPQCHHGKGLLFCDVCCRNAAIQAGLIQGN